MQKSMVESVLRALRVCALVLVSLVLVSRAAQAQSCAGKVAGDICRPSAGSCDVAESCVASIPSSVPMFQPAEGALYTNINWAYNMGYGFTPNKTITVTALGGFFNGTKTVYLYNRSSGVVIASATVAAANSWGYSTITPVTLSAGTPYSISVYLAGSGATYRAGVAMPRVLADATIDAARGLRWRKAQSEREMILAGDETQWMQPPSNDLRPRMRPARLKRVASTSCESRDK